MATRAPSSIPANVVTQYTGVTVNEITAQLNRQTLQERTQSDAIEPVVMRRRNPTRKVNQTKKGGMPSSHASMKRPTKMAMPLSSMSNMSNMSNMDAQDASNPPSPPTPSNHAGRNGVQFPPVQHQSNTSSVLSTPPPAMPPRPMRSMRSSTKNQRQRRTLTPTTNNALPSLGPSNNTLQKDGTNISSGIEMDQKVDQILQRREERNQKKEEKQKQMDENNSSGNAKGGTPINNPKKWLKMLKKKKN